MLQELFGPKYMVDRRKTLSFIPWSHIFGMVSTYYSLRFTVVAMILSYGYRLQVYMDFLHMDLAQL
jgi:hypothetical protein